MTVYKCPRCGFTVNNINKITFHINGNKCKPNLKLAIPLSSNLDNYIIENPFICVCNKTFTSKSYLDKHIKNYCKNKVTQSTDIIISNQQIQETPTTNANNINQITQNNITQTQTQQTQTQNNINNITIVVLPHNKPNISHLTDLDYYNILGRSLNSIPQMIEQIHFNKNMPQNHNLYISNIKNKYIMAYNGKEWSIKNRDDIITDLINENELRLEDWLSSEEHIHKKYPNAMDRFDHYLRMKEKDKNLDMIKNEIQMLLYNKRNMIKN